LDSKIGSHSVEGQQMRELMQGFDRQKRKFNRDHRDIKMDLPHPLENLTKGNTVVGGEITITKSVTTFLFFYCKLMRISETMRSFFDPCVDRIVELILGQIAQVDKLRTRVKVLVYLAIEIVCIKLIFVTEYLPRWRLRRIRIFAAGN
jgi:hypothetical protein